MQVKKIVKFNDKEVKYAGNYARSEIRKDTKLSLEDKEVLLNYPIVYVHTWLEEEKRFFYVGETIDLVKRTNQHKETAEDMDERNKWQPRWIENGKDRVSFYFSHEEMNKSICLDLEDSLIKVLIEALGKEYVKNGRYNEQNEYSNSTKRDSFLEEMYNEIKETFGELPSYSEVRKKVDVKTHNKYDDEEVWYSESFSGPDDLSKKLDDYPSFFREYPAIYIHVWIDEKNDLNTYVGETNNIISRTRQHFENTNIDIYLKRKYLFDDNQDWREGWIKAASNNKAWMFAYSNSKEMNKSITLDLENLLINYMILEEHSNSKNGRTNEQRKYCNREKLKDIFEKIIKKISTEDSSFINWLTKNKVEVGFDTIEAVRDKSVFMASPLTVLSDKQLKAKNNLCVEIGKQFSKVNSTEKHCLYIIEGGAGTGKTIIASSLFFDLQDVLMSDDVSGMQNKMRKLKIEFLVNHDELYSSYNAQNDAKTLGKLNKKRILKPVEFIDSIKRQYLSTALQYIEDANKEDLLEKFKYKGDKAYFYRQISQVMEKAVVNCSVDSKYNDALILEILNKKYTGEEIEALCNIVFNKIKILPVIDLPDIVIVDEGHLLAVDGRGGTAPESQLAYIVSKVKMTILVFDLKQFVKKNAYIEHKNRNIVEVLTYFLKDKIDNFEDKVDVYSSLILKEQFRMECSEDTVNWLSELSKNGGIIKNIFNDTDKYTVKNHVIIECDEKGSPIYEIGICESIKEMLDIMKEKKNLSKIVATYNWAYKKDDKPNVFRIENREFVWHKTKKGKEVWTKKGILVDNKNEIIEPIEIGAYHDIQGFDLNYVGVIIGPSFTYCDKRINIIPTNRADVIEKKPTENISELISNELAILLSRGKKGVCIYATDPALRGKLMDIVKQHT